jgi:ethanolamine ammonia-lyase large subunit
MLIGERPGGDCASSRSLSAYLAYRVCNETEAENALKLNHKSRYEYTVLSNIYNKGTPPRQAALLIAERIQEILSNRAAGNRLEKILQDTKTS